MKRITCEVCGSIDLIKKEGLFECQYCGCKYSLEEVKKLMVEGTVKIDKSDEIQSLTKRAFMHLEEGKWADANELLDQILNQNPENAQAYVGKLMVQLRVRTENGIGEIPVSIEESINYKHIMQWGDEDLKARFEQYAKKEHVIGSVNQMIHSKDENTDGLTKVILNDNVCDYAFYEDAVIKKVILLDGVKSIGNYAFSKCLRLEFIKLSSSLKSIGDHAFEWSPVPSLKIPLSVTYIGAYSLHPCGPQVITYDGTTKDIEKINAWYTNMITCSDSLEIRRKQQEETDRQRREKEAKIQRWKAAGLCQHCGNKFTGLFSKECTGCHRKKDY